MHCEVYGSGTIVPCTEHGRLTADVYLLIHVVRGKK